MDVAEQWNWVGLAYGATYISLVVYAAAVANRISKARQRLDGGS
jgi:hypothetical protein